MKLRQHWFSAVMSAVVFVFLFLPIIVVFKDAFNANKTLLTWGGATFTWFGEALSSERFRSAFLTSIGIAVVVMLLSMVLASRDRNVENERQGERRVRFLGFPTHHIAGNRNCRRIVRRCPHARFQTWTSLGRYRANADLFRLRIRDDFRTTYEYFRTI